MQMDVFNIDKFIKNSILKSLFFHFLMFHSFSLYYFFNHG